MPRRVSSRIVARSALDGVSGDMPPSRIADASGWSAYGSPDAAEPRPAALHDDAVERQHDRTLVLGQCCRVDAVLAGGLDRRSQSPSGGARARRRRRPVADRRFDGDAGQQLELTDVDPAALGDRPLDGAVGRGVRRLRDRRDVEHLTTADRLVASRLAQHVPIARQQWQRHREEQAHRRLAPGANASAPSRRSRTG